MNKVILNVMLISFCCLSASLTAQQERLVDCPIEQAEDVGLWDKLISEKLNALYPDKEMLAHCSSVAFGRVIQDEDIQLIDARTQAEYDEDHIAGALLIDIRKEDFDEQVAKLLHPEKPVAIYCRGGVRSRKATERLLLKGYRVYNLDKGFAQWKSDGMPVEKEDK